VFSVSFYFTSPFFFLCFFLHALNCSLRRFLNRARSGRRTARARQSPLTIRGSDFDPVSELIPDDPGIIVTFRSRRGVRQRSCVATICLECKVRDCTLLVVTWPVRRQQFRRPFENPAKASFTNRAAGVRDDPAFAGPPGRMGAPDGPFGLRRVRFFAAEPRLLGAIANQRLPSLMVLASGESIASHQ